MKSLQFNIDNSISNYIFDCIKKYRNAFYGFSILYIILYHMGVSPIFGRGFIGVDVFLFFSAFGCCFSLQKHSLATFYIRRLNRIYPLFVISNLLKQLIERYNGLELEAWDSFCDITGLTYFGVGGIHKLWFIPSLMILYIITPPYLGLLTNFRELHC